MITVRGAFHPHPADTQGATSLQSDNINHKMLKSRCDCYGDDKCVFRLIVQMQDDIICFSGDVQFVFTSGDRPFPRAQSRLGGYGLRSETVLINILIIIIN